MIKSLLIVGIGSFFGGALRYGISLFMKSLGAQGFPWGTWTVNLLGCFLFGFLYAWFSKQYSASHPLCLLLTTGFCGGFTTFSTFSNESMQMLQNGNVGAFIGYVATSLVGGIALVGLGYWIVK